MKVIENLELLKKLAPYLEDMLETEMYMVNSKWECNPYNSVMQSNLSWYIKTIWLEESIELLPDSIYQEPYCYWLEIYKYKTGYDVGYLDGTDSLNFIEEKTLLKAVEKMLHYLIDNNLLKLD